MKRILKKNAIKAYKVFLPGMKSKENGFKFEVGKSYSQKGTIELCVNGFHASKNISDCFKYYDFKPENLIAEVLLWGESESGDDKLCARHIKILKQISWKEMLVLANSGHGNSGNSNSGNRNSGDCNSGTMNSGYRNSGSNNSGDRNSGDWNSCDNESGFFNSVKPKEINVFNKKCNLEEWENAEKPSFLYFENSTWIPSSEMSEEEKESNSSNPTTGGYLKQISYKDAWKKSWDNAKSLSNWESEFKKLLKLPNFDKKVFKEISGIDVDNDK